MGSQLSHGLAPSGRGVFENIMSIQSAHTKAGYLLRGLHTTEHRIFYLEELQAVDFSDEEPIAIKKNKRAKAYSKALTRLKHKYPSEYLECVGEAAKLGHPYYFYTKKKKEVYG